MKRIIAGYFVVLGIAVFVLVIAGRFSFADDRFISSPAIHNMMPAMEKKESIENSIRLESISLPELLVYMKLGPNMNILDFGAGTGYFTVAIAKAVRNSAYVFAVDVDRDMLSMIIERAREGSLDNISTILLSSKEGNEPFSQKQRYSRILLNSVLDMLPDPISTLEKFYDSLEKEGLVVIVHPRLFPGFFTLTPTARENVEAMVRELSDDCPLQTIISGTKEKTSRNAGDSDFLSRVEALMLAPHLFDKMARWYSRRLGSHNALLYFSGREGKDILRYGRYLLGISATDHSGQNLDRTLGWNFISGFIIPVWDAHGLVFGRSFYASRKMVELMGEKAGFEVIESRVVWKYYYLVILKKGGK